VDHALGDFCVDCHGGDGTTRDVANAHATLSDPLASPPSKCRACHADAEARAARYIPGRKATSGSGSVRSLPSNEPRRSSGTERANAVLAVLVAALAVVIGFVASRRGRVTLRVPRSLRDVVAAPEWSPVVAGAMLGVTTAVSMAVFGRRLSGGGAYQQMVGPIGRALQPDSVYFGRVLSGGAQWELVAFLGALLGAFASARLSRTFRVRTMPDAEWEKAFGPSIAKRWVIGFLGAALAEFASGLAGGCTASLAVSGGAALAPAAFVFMAAMFAGGIPTAWFLYRRVRP